MTDKTRWISAGVATVLTLAGLLTLSVMRSQDRFPETWPLIGRDKAVAVCESVASGNAIDGGKPDSRVDLTQGQYQEIRKVFSQSRHDDLSQAGVSLIDAAWQYQEIGDEVAALTLVTPMMNAVTRFSSACADHGYVIPLGVDR